MPDIAAVQKMTPAQLEAYKEKLLKQASQQAKAIGNQYDLKVNETLLPDFQLQPPPKDFARLSLIPKQPPTLIQLADGLRASKKSLEDVAPQAAVEEVKKITSTQTPAGQQSSAIGAFYAGRPAEALLIAMNSALQNMQEAAGLNNLAAMLNMVKLEHKAVPILMHLLEKEPTNSLFLNNMGQAYLGLGDLTVAEDFLKRCLAEDEGHPEANRSMGLIRFFQKQYDEGAAYFEKELQVAHRRSTLALLKQQGHRFNLYELRQKSGRVPARNYFEEAALGKFQLPEFPLKSDDSRKVLASAASFGQSVYEEMQFWTKAATERNEEEEKTEGRQHFSVYHDLVEEMLRDFDGLFPAEKRQLFEDDDRAHLQAMLVAYQTNFYGIKCAQPPAGSTMAVQEAYAKKCCDLRKSITDAFMQEYNGYVAKRIAVVLPRWKHYLNGLLNIASLEPGLANKKLVYHNVAQYFNFLRTAWGSAQFPDPPAECNTNLTAEQAGEIIASSRNITLNCPAWLNIEFDLKAAKFKADCSKYSIEVGQGLQAAYEKDFKTGTSTLAAGVGVKAKFWHLGKVSAKQMVYISCDNNNEFSDIGLRGQAGAALGLNSEALAVDDVGKVAATLLGVEAGYTLGMSAGYGYIKGSGFLKDYIKLETPKLNFQKP